MAISYGELGYISELTNKGLKEMFEETENPYQTDYQGEDLEVMRNAILSEMESRGLEHP
jgi:hypothetical protein